MGGGMQPDLTPTMTSPDLAGGRVTVDLGALVSNWRELAQFAGSAATSAVVKGDAYGVGLEAAARALSKAGCQTFFVALPEEGLRLRAAVRNATIYVLNGLMPECAAAYTSAKLRPVLGTWSEIEEWAELRGNGINVGSAIHVDTGMHRLGLTPGEFRQLSQERDLLAAIFPDLIMSHLASADTPDHSLNRIQLAAFRAVCVLLPDIPASLANSGGIMLGSDYHFDLVRPGIALYGGAFVGGASPMRPVVTLEARILQIRDIKSGESVGYGAAETAAQDSRIAVVAVGYADGYHRRAGSTDVQAGAQGFLHGCYLPLIGRVSMDLIAIDVTGLSRVGRGDWIELIGPNVPLDEVAHHAGTIGYEILTALGCRYSRRYIGP